MKTTDGVVVRERECLGDDIQCVGDRALSYLNEDYLVAKCMPSGEGDVESEGGRRQGGRGRGTHRRGRGGRRGEQEDGGESQNAMADVEEMDENEDEEEPTGRRGGRRRGDNRRRTPKVQ